MSGDSTRPFNDHYGHAIPATLDVEKVAQQQMSGAFCDTVDKEIEELRKTGALKPNWYPEQCGEITASPDTIAWAERDVTGRTE